MVWESTSTCHPHDLTRNLSLSLSLSLSASLSFSQVGAAAMASSFRSFRSIKAPSPAALSAPCRMRLSPTPISSLRVDPVPFSQRCPDEQSRFYATPRARAPRGQNPAVRAKAKTWADLQKPAVLSNDLVATYNLETIIRTAGFRHQPHQYTDCTEKFKSVADRGDHRWPFLLSEGKVDP